MIVIIVYENRFSNSPRKHYSLIKLSGYGIFSLNLQVDTDITK